MALHNRGLSKLVEEAGEVLQVAGKLQAYPSGVHPDGGKDLHLRLEDELADLYAAMKVVEVKFKLNRRGISLRSAEKLILFMKWADESP